MCSRNWLFTLNNPTEEECPKKWKLDLLKLVIYQEEVGETGTPHYQGYVEFTTPRRITTLKTISPRAHWETRSGTRDQAVLYVTKDDTRTQFPQGWSARNPNEWTTFNPEDVNSFWSYLGFKKMPEAKSSDKDYANKRRLLNIKDKLLNGSTSVKQVSLDDFDLWVRYHRAFNEFVSMHTPPRNGEVEVHIVCGPTGTGKSKWAKDTYPDAYWKQRSKWWDNYFGHTAVVIDEFYGWLQYDTLLRLLDRYPMLVETKGGQVQFVAKHIVITSNMFPHKWYNSDNCYLPALARRITKYHYLPSPGMHIEYNTWDSFNALDK